MIYLKHVFIIGSRGYHEKYGGWETFVTNLVDNYNDGDTKFYISKITTEREEISKTNDNVIVFPIKVSTYSGLNMFLYAIKSLNSAIKIIKREKIDNAYIYILGLKLLNYLGLKKGKIHSLGATIIVNPDGLEWMRSKWNRVAKKFFLLSEKWMLKSSDIIICDSLGIKDYIDKKYPKVSNRTKYIAYGSNSYDFSNINELNLLKKYNLNKDAYCLMVGRCVPENNYEFVINEFRNSNIKKDLIIISNLDSSNYYNELINKTNCLKDKRIKFINGVYDPKSLAVIRKNAYLYIHGHSVGGTNPSLIEALSLTNLSILYDVNFNRYIGEDSCLYFKNSGELTKILNDIDYLNSVKEEKGKKAKQLVKSKYTWDIIVDKYKEIFK